MCLISDIAKPLIPFEIIDRTSNQGGDVAVLILTKDSKKKYLEIDELTKAVLGYIDYEKTFDDIFKRIKLDFQLKESEFDLFEEFCNTKLSKYLFDSSHKFDVIATSKYVFLKVKIIPEDRLVKISVFFTFLFRKRIFMFFGLFMAIFLVLSFYFYSIDFNNLYIYLNAENSVLFSFGYLICVLIHELGHATAALHFKTKPNHIGFGFYLFTPIMYCDVSDIWTLNNKKRIVVDLAGIYFQWIISFVLVLFFMISGLEFFIYFSFFNFLSSLLNLNPLLRFDGYWALSDLFETPNLRRKSFIEVKSIFNEVFRLNFSRRGLKDYFIVFYGFLSLIMIGLFLYFMLFKNTDSLIYYFKNAADLFLSFFLDNNDLTYDSIKSKILSLIAPSIFYFLVINFVISKLKDKLWKRS
jgi:putative peptide zinc metalloprotease protein